MNAIKKYYYFAKTLNSIKHKLKVKMYIKTNDKILLTSDY